MMESTTLSMIHRSECPYEMKGASESWAKKLPKGKEDKREDKQQEKRKQQTRKERRQANQTTNEQKADKPAGNPCLTLWSKVLMLNQKLVRDWLELLLGKPSAGVQMN